MEYLDGVSLRQLVSNRQITPQQALVLIPQICEALQFAHDARIVHRDIKPEQIHGPFRLAFNSARSRAARLSRSVKDSASNS